MVDGERGGQRSPRGRQEAESVGIARCARLLGGMVPGCLARELRRGPSGWRCSRRGGRDRPGSPRGSVRRSRRKLKRRWRSAHEFVPAFVCSKRPGRRPRPTVCPAQIVGESRRDSPESGLSARAVSSHTTTPIAALWDVPPPIPRCSSLVARRFMPRPSLRSGTCHPIFHASRKCLSPLDSCSFNPQPQARMVLGKTSSPEHRITRQSRNPITRSWRAPPAGGGLSSPAAAG